MNAAFVLLTTACLAGQQTPAAPAQPAPTQPAPTAKPAAPATAPAAPAPAVVHDASCNGCGAACDSCCEREGFLSRLRNKFRKSDCCEDYYQTVPKMDRWKPRPIEHCNQGCDSCDSGCGKRRGRLRGLLHRGNDCGCDTGCNGAVITAPAAPSGAMPKAGESIPAPKEKEAKPPMPMPKGNVQGAPRPATAPALEVAPTAPKAGLSFDSKTPF